METNKKKIIKERLTESANIKNEIASNEEQTQLLFDVSNLIVEIIKNGGKLILCGNGGSASDSLHFAGEMVGRFQRERKPWPAIVLNADVATLTSIGNDYGFDYVFSRQIDAFATNKDFFIGISTSGNSKNIITAVLACKEKKCKTFILTGKDGGLLKNLSDFCFIVPSFSTARIQETHITIIHILCELVEGMLSE